MENKILFSEEAYDDGYDFSSLTENEQKLTKEYYSSKEEIREVAQLVKAAGYYIRHSDFDCSVKPLIDYDWRFFESGSYEAVIVRCSKSVKMDSDDYILELMLDEYTIKYIKFKPFDDNPITTAILDELNYHENYGNLVGRYIVFDIENNPYGRNKVFSNVTSFKFIEKNIITLHMKMWEIIQNTDLKNMIRNRNYKSL